MAEALTMWEGRKVMILLPSYREIHPAVHYSLFCNYARYGAEKLAMDFQDMTMIHEARNILTQRGLQNKDVETFIMFDDDVIPPCGNPPLWKVKYSSPLPEKITSRNAISRLMSHGRDKGIVGGLYFGRNKEGKAQCHSGFGDPKANADYHQHRNDGLVPELWVATGCLKIERWVFEKMKQAIDDGKWPECKPFGNRPDQWYGFWNPQSTAVGEDASFGCRAHEIGIQSYVDAGLECLHLGYIPYGSHNTKI